MEVPMRRSVVLFLFLGLVLLLTSGSVVRAQEPTPQPLRCVCSDGQPLPYDPVLVFSSPTSDGYLLQVMTWEMTDYKWCYEDCLRQCGCDPADPDLTCSFNCLVGGTTGPNRPPTVALTYSPSNPAPEDTIRFSANASDPDGDEITYEWYLDGTRQTNMTGPIVEWKNPREGPHTTTVKVSDGKGGSAEDSVTFTVETDGELTVELNIGEGQKFTQGDDFTVIAQVFRGEQPVAGATVELYVYSPSGRDYGHADLTTDENGQVERRAYFTVDAAVGMWELVAEAEAPTDTDTDEAELTREFELVKFQVSEAQVQKNIETISALWESSPEVPNGVTAYPFIATFWWPKGPKVNLGSLVNARLASYTCSALSWTTLRFLNGLRFSISKDTRLLMAGVDYGPINDGTGLIHTAVALYPHGSHWRRGYVLEPWWNQEKESWHGILWSTTFLAGDTPGNNWLWGNLWEGEYPTTGSDGGYYPGPASAPPILIGNRMRVLTYCPVEILVVDPRGQRVGLLDGIFVNEIPDAEQAHAVSEDGTSVSMISVPEGQYQVTITGTGNGTYHLVTGTDNDIVNYGEQLILLGEQATFTLKSSDLNQPLKLPSGSSVLPQHGLLESGGQLPDEETHESGGDGDGSILTREDILGILMLVGGGLLFILFRLRRRSARSAPGTEKEKHSQKKAADVAIEQVKEEGDKVQGKRSRKTADNLTSTCPQCGSPIRSGARFCRQCGAPLAGQVVPAGQVICPQCGQSNHPQARFCSHCGTLLSIP
ncbi:MAG: hypothetical protein CO171_08510 [Syntrophobacterales bacterium CG_4_9_14_3_um_filter_49_8]|nr:MAG: hypothetical protein CO171_08510 [Syntrophobacterales bacterium CG_4_9_14_3_um_filter_49_8]